MIMIEDVTSKKVKHNKSDDGSQSSEVIDTEELKEKQEQMKSQIVKENVGESANVDWFIISVSNIYYQYYKGFLILLNFWSSFIYAYCSTYMEHLSDSAMKRFRILD